MRKRVAQCSSKVSVKKFMNKWEKKDLETLADDFGLLQRNDVQEIIQNCKTYAEGQRKIMRVYTKVYL
jgi:flavorubredoxin